MSHQPFDLRLQVGGGSLNGEAPQTDGHGACLTLQGGTLDDTGSFTVTTSVELNETKLAAKSIGYSGQIVGQRTTDGSAWGLWYELTGKETVLDEETRG
uniref:hypothetical protein n=1 Tax=Streptomyces sp. TG1A-60 TaxID=3129111 RepID=UPI0040401535